MRIFWFQIWNRDAYEYETKGKQIELISVVRLVKLKARDLNFKLTLTPTKIVCNIPHLYISLVRKLTQQMHSWIQKTSIQIVLLFKESRNPLCYRRLLQLVFPLNFGKIFGEIFFRNVAVSVTNNNVTERCLPKIKI